MNIEPMLRIKSTDLDNLLSTLDVNVLSLTECLVSRGYRLEMGGADVAGLHYNLTGTARMFLGNAAPVELKPHTLVVVPAKTPFRIETTPLPGRTEALAPVGGPIKKKDGMLTRVVAGEKEPEILMICGFFKATYGASTDLFTALDKPIVEQFDETDKLEHTLRIALNELVQQEAGSGAMSSALLKQVVVTLLRRSMTSLDLWAERFAMLSDPQIARVFGKMAANPGADHSVQSLCESACLSRSAFMARFTALVGHSPMVILRDLRMRQAAKQLKANNMTVDQIANASGYDSRSSFSRAFRKVFDVDPTDYREMALSEPENLPACVIS
jgi:AraC family transcriptional activator of mtrCDE